MLLVTDIETVPDRALLPPDFPADSSPKPIHHKVVAISFVRAGLARPGAYERYDVLECRSGGTAAMGEADLLRGFWALVDRHGPRIVTWNGRAFDMAVLQQRALIHGIPTRAWHRTGEYRIRYRTSRHCDLMDALSDHGASPKLGLDETARALGLPGKLGVHGSDVERMVAEGRIEDVRAYCETDVLNLFGIYLRWSFVSGLTDAEGHNAAIVGLERLLEAERSEGRGHLTAWLEAWLRQPEERRLVPDNVAHRELGDAAPELDPPHLASEDV